MATREDQAQPVVGHDGLLAVDGGVPGFVQPGGLGVLAGAGLLPADPVDRAAPGGGDDPPGRARRQPVDRPPGDGDGERVLHGFLGQVDVPEGADERGDRTAVFGAEHARDLLGHGRVTRSARPAAAAPRSAA
jgi:hypothetical protein